MHDELETGILLGGAILVTFLISIIFILTAPNKNLQAIEPQNHNSICTTEGQKCYTNGKVGHCKADNCVKKSNDSWNLMNQPAGFSPFSPFGVPLP